MVGPPRHRTRREGGSGSKGLSQSPRGDTPGGLGDYTPRMTTAGRAGRTPGTLDAGSLLNDPAWKRSMHNARMRTMFYLSLSLLLAHASFAQTAAPPPRQVPAAPAAPTAPAAPAAPAPPRRAPAPAPASRSGIALTVTDPRGLPIPEVRVTVAGLSDRSGETNDSGQVNFVGMQPGTYRVRFDSDKVISFEKEVVVRSGQTTSFDAILNPAPPPPAPPPPAPAPVAAPAAKVGPPGMPQVLSIVDLAEKQMKILETVRGE